MSSGLLIYGFYECGLLFGILHMEGVQFDRLLGILYMEGIQFSVRADHATGDVAG